MSAADDGPGSPPLVELRGITKAYPGVLANDRIDLVLSPGRVHALLGENGAGKSTLVQILYGVLGRDAGEILWEGRPVEIPNPAAARSLGIAMVFQHFSLFESLTVLENIALGMAVDASPTLRSDIIDVSARYGLPLDPDRSVFSLSVGARQRIEICRCLLQSPRLLIMDEPTSVLTPQEVEDLFETLSRLADEGLAILYISHKLDEIRRLCHEASILRHGRLVATADPRDESAQSLAALMMGTDIDARDRQVPGPRSEAKRPAAEAGRLANVVPAENVGKADDTRAAANDASLRLGPAPRFQVVSLDVPAEVSQGLALHDINIEVSAGEIVGIAGIAGNGQDELLACLAGEVTTASDRVRLDGEFIGHIGAGERRRLGLCCVPEERLGHAAVPSMTLTENAFLTAHHRRVMRRFGLLSFGASRRFANEVIERFDVRCNGPDSLASSLSGGNLQKFIVGREILQSPSVLVVSQPTWGVDAGAAKTIHDALVTLARQDTAVLVISQDLDELLLLANRIGALCAGRLSALHDATEVTAREVGLLMGGETLQKDADRAIAGRSG